MYARLLPIYIGTVFLLHGLSPVPWLPFNFFIATPVLILAALDPIAQARGLRFRGDDIGFGLVYLLGFIPLVMYPANIGIQNFLYAGQWFVVWLVSFWWLREWILLSRMRFDRISRAAALGCITLSVAVIAEFTSVNTIGYYLSDFLYFSISHFPDATVLGDRFVRPRGFASEAGFTAIAFECLLPLSISWFRRSWSRIATFCILVAPGYLLLFSAASISFLLGTLIIFVAVYRGIKNAVLVAIIGLGVIAGLAVTSGNALWVIDEVILRKFAEFTPGAFVGNPVGLSRPEAYLFALRLLWERPFGIGWGAVSQQVSNSGAMLGVELKGSGLISVPLEIGVAAGILGMAVFVFLVIRKLHRLSQAASEPARLIFFSLLWVSFHHIVVLELWFPMLWLTLALADCVRIEARRHDAHSIFSD